MKSILKSVGKFLLIIIVILGIYYSRQVEPAEKQRLERGLDNLNAQEHFGYDLEFDLNQEGNYYYLTSEGDYKEGDLRGDFSVETRLEGASEIIEGEYIYKNPNLYLNFDEDGLPITLETFFRENYNLEIEEARNNWVKSTVELPVDKLNYSGEVPEVISESEEIEEDEMYQYKGMFKWEDVVEESFPIEMFIRKRDLDVKRVKLDSQLAFSKFFNPGEPFPEIVTRREVEIESVIDFFESEKKEVAPPESYLEL